MITTICPFEDPIWDFHMHIMSSAVLHVVPKLLFPIESNPRSPDIPCRKETKGIHLWAEDMQR